MNNYFTEMCSGSETGSYSRLIDFCIKCGMFARRRTWVLEGGEDVDGVIRMQVQGSGLRVQGSGCRVQGSGFRVKGSGFRVQGSGFRVQGAGFRVQGSGFAVEGLGIRI